MRLDLIFAEFGPGRFNNGDAKLPLDRLEPSLSSFRKYFPEARVVLYTDQNYEHPEVVVKRVENPFAPNAREGNRANDYFDAVGLLESDADVAVALDSDIVFCGEREHVRSLIPLTLKFGLCMPSGGRHSLWRDARSSCDGGPVQDESRGCGMAHCTALWSFNTKSARHRDLLSAYCHQMHEDVKTRRGARGPLSFWRATWETGIYPYTLPREWTVTGSNLGDIRVSGRVVPLGLHVGHAAVETHYRELLG